MTEPGPAAETVRRGTQVADLRPARPDELGACAAIWRISTNDYIMRRGEPEIPDDLTNITTLYEHLQATDPSLFVVAVRPDASAPGGERVVAFASAVVRGGLWFLSMLFVLPEEQGLGLGRALLVRVLPPAGSGLSLGTATDSLQPISNALYSTHGIVPRMPLLHLLGDVHRPDALPGLPPGVTATPFEAIAAGPPEGPGHRALAEAIGRLDREIVGLEHPADHRYLRLGGRRGFLYRDAQGADLGYGYGSEVGRFGPVAVLDPGHLGPIIGHLIRAVTPRGALAFWVPGVATDAVTTLLAAGLRLDGYPILLCWDRPFVDLARYLPISPGLL